MTDYREKVEQIRLRHDSPGMHRGTQANADVATLLEAYNAALRERNEWRDLAQKRHDERNAWEKDSKEHYVREGVWESKWEAEIARSANLVGALEEIIADPYQDLQYHKPLAEKALAAYRSGVK